LFAVSGFNAPKRNRDEEYIAMKLEIHKENGFLVVCPLEKRLDAKVGEDFRNKLLDLIRKGNRNLLLDLRHVKLVDSSGLGAMVSALKFLGKNGNLKICSVGPKVRFMLELTRLHKVFTIYDCPQEAFAGQDDSLYPSPKH